MARVRVQTHSQNRLFFLLLPVTYHIFPSCAVHPSGPMIPWPRVVDAGAPAGHVTFALAAHYRAPPGTPRAAAAPVDSLVNPSPVAAPPHPPAHLLVSPRNPSLRRLCRIPAPAAPSLPHQPRGVLLTADFHRSGPPRVTCPQPK